MPRRFLFFAKYDEWQTSEFSNRFLMTFVAGSSVLTAGYLEFLAHRFLPGMVHDRGSP